MYSPHKQCTTLPGVTAPTCRQGSSREARQLHPTLLDLCITHIEEGLYPQGFFLLSSALTSGTTSSVPAQLPPADLLAFAATLVVHPQLTSRTTSPDKHAAADEALRYLREVNALVGPRNANLGEAFQFRSDGTSSRGKRAKTRLSDLTSVLGDDEPFQVAQINSTYATTGSLWTNADDFWSIVGWAFNCSVCHPARWQRWKLFLDLLFDILNDDLDARLPAAQQAYQAKGTGAVQASLKECLFTKYLSPIGEGRNSKRRLMRAIVADGSSKALSEFDAIWRHETKPPKQREAEPLSKRRKLDLENGEFGDYLDDSDEESPGSSIRRSRSVTTVPPSRRSGPTTDAEDDSGSELSGANSSPPGVEAFGGMESLRLRQRLLSLLTRYCSLNPDEFLDTEDLFDLYTEFLRPLLLPVFQQFALPSKPYLSPLSQAVLNQMLLRPLLAATAPRYSEKAVTQEEFEEHYAPHPANRGSAIDNAKVSLLVESLLRFLWTSKTLTVTARLRREVQRGIAARKDKVAWDGRRRTGMNAKADEEAMLALEASAERMVMVLDVNG